MILKLIQLPDCKLHHAMLTVGKNYAVLKEVGNGVAIYLDDCSDTILILRSRFE